MSAIFFLLSFLVAGTLAANNTVQVSVYYESLCSDSINFFKNKLIPTYTQKDFNFSNLTSKLEIIPFGKAHKEAPGNYTCQHGPSECEGNKLHACAIKFITDQPTLLNFIGCLMNATTLPLNKTLPYPDADQCKTQAGSVFDSITNCYKGEEGATLFASYGDKTTQFFQQANYSVPYIAFNNKKDDVQSNNAIDNYRKTLCTQVGLNDDHCSDVPKSGAAILSAPFALISALLFFFYTAQ